MVFDVGRSRSIMISMRCLESPEYGLPPGTGYVKLSTYDREHGRSMDFLLSSETLGKLNKNVSQVGKQLAKVDGAELDLWRTGCTGMRPKWGLYRNFGEGRSMASQLRDEVLKFADFDIRKLK